MTPADGTAVQVTLSGRELALMRRQAMALRGKAAVTRPAATQSARAGAAISTPAWSASGDVAPAVALAPTVSAARQRRHALSQSGKSALVAQASARRPVQAVSEPVASDTNLAAVAPQQDRQQAIDKGVSSRQVAMQRRTVRALVGSSDTHSASPRPSGRVRGENESAAVPTKVAQGHTLSGQTVTGTRVDNSRKVTGNEAGSCRSITGTEYLDLEQFNALCGTRPAPGPAKVGVSSTLREQRVTGTEVGRSARVTGDEVGACRGITGTEYLAREHYEAACDITPVAAPRKVSVMSSQGGQSVSGSAVGRSAKVTGDESGASRQITGTEYIGTRQLQAVCAASTRVQPVAKVGQDQTWRGQTITGSHVGRSSKVTGDEYGGCASISGTPYIGRGQYQAFCEAPQVDSQQALTRSEAVIPAAAVTGGRPGAGGSVMTGDERGACGLVSGTPYMGQDNMPKQCQSSGRFVPRVRSGNEAPATPAPQDFSIRPPARQAQQRGLETVTGMASGGQRITGPVNKAGGLITGTPEFRRSEALPFAAPQIEVASAATRLTGEGSQAGVRVSGDAWQTSGRVTGTEGTSSLARNPSQRGQARDMGMNALQFRDVERAAPPQSRITGSSGNSVKGAAVTLSGGARG